MVSELGREDGQVSGREWQKWAKNYLRLTRPMTKLTTAMATKTKNKILAMPTAPAAMPPKPKMAAIKAMTRKTTA